MIVNCRELVTFLANYLESLLPQAERVQLEEHLQECPDCANYLATYQATIRLAQTSWDEGCESILTEIPEDLVQAVEDTVGQFAATEVVLVTADDERDPAAAEAAAELGERLVTPFRRLRVSGRAAR